NISDTTIQLIHWDVESGAVISSLNYELSERINSPSDIGISPDGNILVVTAGWRSYSFDIHPLSFKKYFWHNFGAMTSLALHPDGENAITSNGAGAMIMWSYHSRNEEIPGVVRRYTHGNIVPALAFNNDGTRFLSASTDQTIVLWDTKREEQIRTFNGHTDAVNSVAFTPDESRIISASADGTLILWDVATGEALRTFSEHSAGVWKVVLSPDGKLAYSAGQDGLVIVRPIEELNVEEILAFIEENRVLREFTCEEREQYRILPLCDASGEVPDN
ncbi:MAG: hypothetical protein R3307_11215, partial [Anaerolineales bacterium]|nr:hypothetical protein [Anaerolineales bacterium]